MQILFIQWNDQDDRLRHKRRSVSYETVYNTLQCIKHLIEWCRPHTNSNKLNRTNHAKDCMNLISSDYFPILRTQPEENWEVTPQIRLLEILALKTSENRMRVNSERHVQKTKWGPVWTKGWKSVGFEIGNKSCNSCVIILAERVLQTWNEVSHAWMTHIRNEMWTHILLPKKVCKNREESRCTYYQRV
jgi:hypothetical protein